MHYRPRYATAAVGRKSVPAHGTHVGSMRMRRQRGQHVMSLIGSVHCTI